MPDIADEILEIIVKHLDIEDVASIQPGSRLREDLGADDLDVVDIVVAVAEHYHAEVKDEEFGSVMLVSDIARVIGSAEKVA